MNLVKKLMKLEKLKKCNNCSLCLNQRPLLDTSRNCDIMWVGLSAKKVDNISTSIPLDNDANSGKIIELIEDKLPQMRFYKTNLVKCLPLDKNNKLRYPNQEEMNACINNLNLEILELNPKIIFVLGKLTYNFISKYFQKNNLDISKLVYLEHPSYIYVYKRKYIDDYINKIVGICNETMYNKINKLR